MLRSSVTGIALTLAVLSGGCSSSSPDTAKIADIEKKVDRILAALDGAPKAQSVPAATGDQSDLKQIAAKIDLLSSRLPIAREASTIDTSKLKRESTTDLAWLLITNDPKEKATLVNRRVQQSGLHKDLSLENVHAVVADVEGLNVILNAPEGLDPAVIQQVEESRGRLVELLRKEIPRIVGELDTKAVKTADYAEAKRLWSQSSAVLGFYPASNDPAEAGRIQEMVTSHDLVRSRSELAQQQRYNLWACQQIRKAWQDFEAQSDQGARMSTCIHFLGPIHAGLLDPVTLELYRDFLQTIRGKLSKELYQELSEKLAVEKRKMLADLQEAK